jgi:hypothetical protein
MVAPSRSNATARLLEPLVSHNPYDKASTDSSVAQRRVRVGFPKVAILTDISTRGYLAITAYVPTTSPELVSEALEGATIPPFLLPRREEGGKTELTAAAKSVKRRIVKRKGEAIAKHICHKIDQPTRNHYRIDQLKLMNLDLTSRAP